MAVEYGIDINNGVILSKDEQNKIKGRDTRKPSLPPIVSPVGKHIIE